MRKIDLDLDVNTLSYSFYIGIDRIFYIPIRCKDEEDRGDVKSYNRGTRKISIVLIS